MTIMPNIVLQIWGCTNKVKTIMSYWCLFQPVNIPKKFPNVTINEQLTQ